MAYTNRGGPPFARNLTATTNAAVATNGVANSTQADLAPYNLPTKTSWVRLAVTTFAVRVYFNQADCTDNLNYVPVAAGAVVEFPMDLAQLWLRGVGGTAVIDVLGIGKV